MKLSEIMTEEASAGAVSAHAVAGSRGSLMGGGTLPTHVLRRMVPPGGTVLKDKKKKQRKVVAGVPVIDFNNEA
jgi:hypothetical protein